MKKIILYSTVAALMIFPALSMAAESDEKMKTLDEVVVTATRSAKDTKTIPANITVITAEEITDSGASSIVEVLESHANIHVRTFSGNPSQAQIDLRGFGENGFGRTLILLDGRRLNRPDMSSVNWNQLPLEQIERIEIVRGSSSVLYGDAAVAGVIHIISKKGALDPSISATIQIGEDGFHNESGGIVGSTEKLSYSINGSNQQTDGWRDRTEYQSYGGGFQIGYDILDNFSISGGASYNKTDFQMPGPLTSAQLYQDRTQTGADYKDDDADNEFKNTNLLLEGSMGNFGDVELNLVYGVSEILSNYGFYLSYTNTEIESFGIQPKYILETNFGYISNQLVTGFDIYNENIVVDKFSDAARHDRTNTSELGKDSVGWYIRDEISFGNNFVLNGGARIEKAEIHGRAVALNPTTIVFDEKKDHEGEVFELGATWLPNKSLKLYTKFATVYRYPFTDEQAYYYGYSSDEFFSDLEAEEGKSIEAGFEFSPYRYFSVGFGLYQTDMEDEIATLWAGWTPYNVNLDETRHRGLEMFIDYELQNFLDLQVNYTYQESTFEAGINEGNDVPLVPNNQVTASLDLTLPYDFHLIPSILYVDDSYLAGDTDNNADKLDNYTVVDLLVRYRKSFDKIQLTAFLGVKNLLDKEYSTFGGDWGMPQYYPSPSRKFFGGISGTF